MTEEKEFLKKYLLTKAEELGETLGVLTIDGSIDNEDFFELLQEMLKKINKGMGKADYCVVEFETLIEALN